MAAGAAEGNIRFAVFARLSDGLSLSTFKGKGCTATTVDTTNKVLRSGNLKAKSQLTVTIDQTIGTLHLAAGDVDVIAVITAPDYPRRSAFKLLDEVRAEADKCILPEGVTGATRDGEYAKQMPFLREACVRYEDLAEVDKITAVGAQVDEVKAGLYKLHPVYPELESAWFQPLNLSSDLLVAWFLSLLSIQLVPLRQGGDGGEHQQDAGQRGDGERGGGQERAAARGGAAVPAAERPREKDDVVAPGQAQAHLRHAHPGHPGGGCARLPPPDPQLKGAWYPGGFNPCTYQVKTRFQSVPFKMQLAPLHPGLHPHPHHRQRHRQEREERLIRERERRV
jgi:hypothetical protein